MDFNAIQANSRRRLDAGPSNESSEHKELLDFVRKCKQNSVSATRKHADRMRQADRIYHAFRVPDEEDNEAKTKGEPIKIIYPVTYAQIQTTLASLMSIFNQHPFFPLEGRQPQSYRNAKLMELELDYQLEQASWTLILYSWLQDMLKYGFGALNVEWSQQLVYMTKDRPIPLLGGLLSMMGLPSTQKVTEPVVGYEGVEFNVNDPYIFLWDPAVSIGEIQKGQFVFNCWKKSHNELMLLQDDPRNGFFNVERVPERVRAHKDEFIGRERGWWGGKGNMPYAANPVIQGGDEVYCDTIYAKIVPLNYKLSDLDRMQIWKITMANDCTIIQAEPSRFEHGVFPTNIIEYNPDVHELVNPGQADVIDGLQDLLNWYLNTNMTSIKKSINDQIIVDPGSVNMEDINSRSPIIRLQPTAKAGIDRYIKQLEVTDYTQNHVKSASNVFDFIQRTTGVNDNSMGVQTDTVRSATETANFARLASARMNLLACLLWDQGVRSAGKQMIQNTQAFSSMERLFKVSGGLSMALGISPDQFPQGFKVTPQDLQGFFSISMISPLSQADKMMRANVLKELLVACFQNPIVIPATGAKPSQILTQILMDSGILNTTDFIRAPSPDQESMMMQQIIASVSKMPEGGVRASVQPDAQVMGEVQKGNLIPTSPMGGGNGRY